MYNILICDDEPDIVSALKIYLSGEDYRIFEAANGRQALEIAAENEIHLVLMDVMMPQLDGIAATVRLREKGNMPILLLTSTGMVPLKALLSEPPAARTYTVGPITLDEEARSVTLDGESVALTPIEYNILRLLIRHPGRIYSSAQIYELVWKESAMGADSAVSVHIRHLRQKLEINPSEPRYLKVVWGLGYKMEGDGRT